MSEIKDLLWELFVNRADVYAEAFLQKRGVGYAKKSSELTKEIIQQHLDKTKTIGVYQLKNRQVKWGCLDFDENTPEDFEKAKKVYNKLRTMGYHLLAENSGGGEYKVHIWVFTDTDATSMKHFLEDACEQAGIKPHEIFPKQTEVKEGEYGNLVKLPLALHLKTRQTSFFYDSEFNKITDEKQVIQELKNHLEHKDTIPKVIIKEKPTYTNQQSQAPIDCPFLNHCLDNELPQGKRHEVISRNMAIYIANKPNGEELKRRYVQAQKGRDKELDNWLKGINAGKQAPFSCGQLINFQKEFNIPIKCKGCPKHEEYVMRREEIEKRGIICQQIIQLICDKKGKEAIYDLACFLMREYDFLTLSDTQEIYFYDEGVYHNGGASLIAQEVEEMLEGFNTTYWTSEVIGHIRRSTYIDREDFENTPQQLLCLKNGILNLETMQLEPFQKDIIFLNKILIEYNKKADCPNIKKFLSEIVNEDDLLVLQEFIGYCLCKEMPFHKALMLVGGGANGKSTFINLLKSFLGLQNCASIPLQKLEKERFSIAHLYGKLANLFADLPSKAMDSSSMFKMLTGGDTVSAEKKFQHGFQFVNHAKMIFSANQVPKTCDDSDAFFRRWIIINFPNIFTDEKADKKLLEKLTTPKELSGLLNFAIEGLKRLLQNGYFSNSTSTDKVREEYLRKSDSVASFIMDIVKLSKGDYIQKKEAYNEYLRYCKKNKCPAVAENTFCKEIISSIKVDDYRPKINGVRVQCWEGIKLKKEVKNSPDTLDMSKDKKTPLTKYIDGMSKRQGKKPIVVNNEEGIQDNKKEILIDVIKIENSSDTSNKKDSFTDECQGSVKGSRQINCYKCNAIVPDPLYIDEVSKKPVCDDCHNKKKGGEKNGK